MNKCDIIDKDNYIQISQKYFKTTGSDFYPFLSIEQRFICIDIINHKMILSPAEDFNDFELEDDDYNTIIEILRNHCKKLFGFTPNIEEGSTNFEKLKNFFNFPFWPQLNNISGEFQTLFNFQEDRLNPDGYKHVLKKMGIEVTESLWKRFINYKESVSNYMVIKELGFTDINILADILDDLHEREIVLHDINSYDMQDITRFVHSNFEYLSQRKMYKTISKCFNSGLERDALCLFNRLDDQFALMDGTKSKILKEGFTDYNHHLMNQLLNRLYNTRIDNIPNYTFKYTEEEKSYEQTIDDYEFHLLKDTDFMKFLGSVMNNCVYSCYRTPAINRHCLIAYATTQSKIKLCIELRPFKNSYKIEQAKAYANAQPNQEQLEVLEKWIKACGFSKIYFC